MQLGWFTANSEVRWRVRPHPMICSACSAVTGVGVIDGVLYPVPSVRVVAAGEADRVRHVRLRTPHPAVLGPLPMLYSLYAIAMHSLFRSPRIRVIQASCAQRSRRSTCQSNGPPPVARCVGCRRLAHRRRGVVQAPSLMQSIVMTSTRGSTSHRFVAELRSGAHERTHNDALR